MAATLAELDARVAALEAERTDYRAVLAAINALGENQREHATQLRSHGEQLRSHGEQLRRLGDRLDDTNARVRSIEENVAEVKDLLIRALDR